MKTLLITGATSGIGLALAHHAAKCGYKVLACGRNQSALDKLEEIVNIDTLQFDVTNELETQEVLKQCEFDTAVLNAGTCEYVEVDKFEPAMFKRVFEPNFFGVVNCVNALLPSIKSGQSLVFVDSMARFLPFTQAQAYGASKAALYYFAKSLEVDLLDKGVTVQTVSPGFVKTPLTDKNEFDMPMLISAEQAAIDMLAAIEKGKRSIFFPTVFGLILRTFNILPANLKRKLAYSMRVKALQNLKEQEKV